MILTREHVWVYPRERRFQTKLKEKAYQLKMLMILNEEMTKAQNFFAPAATNKGMITTFSNRTNIFVKWKTDNEKLRIKTEVRSKFKIILTTFDKEFNRKMSIRSLKPLIFSKKPAVLANSQISKKILKNISEWNEVENWKIWVFFFLSYSRKGS